MTRFELMRDNLMESNKESTIDVSDKELRSWTNHCYANIIWWNANMFLYGFNIRVIE